MSQQAHPGEDLTALLDGALAPGRAAEVEAHLEGCPACRAELARLRAGVVALAALPPPPEPSPFFAARLEARLREERARPRGLAGRARAALGRWAPRPRALAYGGLAAALVVAAAAGGWRYLDTRRMVGDLDLLEEYDVAAMDLDSPEDAEIVAQLDQLSTGEATP